MININKFLCKKLKRAAIKYFAHEPLAFKYMAVNSYRGENIKKLIVTGLKFCVVPTLTK